MHNSSHPPLTPQNHDSIIYALAETAGWDFASSQFSYGPKSSTAAQYKAIYALMGYSSETSTLHQQTLKLLDALQIEALCKIAIKNRWRPLLAEVMSDPYITLSRMYGALWPGSGPNAKRNVDAALKIFNAWTSGKLKSTASILELETEISSTLFGEHWWFLRDPENDPHLSLAEIVLKERPPLKTQWLKGYQSQSIALPQTVSPGDIA